MRGSIFILAGLIFVAAGVARASGLDRTFGLSYEMATNKVSALKPNPAANVPASGNELVPGTSYRWWLPESIVGDVSGIDTTIIISKIDANKVRIHVETFKRGLVIKTREPKLEKWRMNELIQLLSSPSPTRMTAPIEL